MMFVLPAIGSLHGAEGEAADELALAQPAEQEDGRDRQGRGGGQLRPEQPLGAGEGGDEGGERGRLGCRQVETPEGLVPEQDDRQQGGRRSEEHTSEPTSLVRTSYAVFCLNKTTQPT